MIAASLARELAARPDRLGEYRGFADLVMRFAHWSARGAMPSSCGDPLGRLTPSSYERETGISESDALLLDQAVTAARQTAPDMFKVFNGLILHDVDADRLIRQRSMQAACSRLRVSCTPSILKALTILFVERVRLALLSIPDRERP